jgi:hypothetical protein
VTALPLDKALALAGLVACFVACLWMLGRDLARLGWDTVLKMLRDPPFFLVLLGVLLIAASYFL